MQISITFRHLDPSEALKDHAAEKLAHLNKYLDGSTEAHVVLSAEKHFKQADIQIASHNMLMRGKEDSGDMYASIDGAVHKIEKQVKRYLDKIKTNKPRQGAKRKIKFNTLSANGHDLAHDKSVFPTNIIETKEVEARPMMLDEACMQMDLLGSDLLVFTNAKTDHLNILYRKKNQKFGLVETL